MPSKTRDLHGNAPDDCHIALLLVDVINDFEFETARELFPKAMRAARELAALKQRARRANVPCLYVNDNYGRWRSDFTAQVEHCLNDDVRGRPIVELLAPAPEDYFVLKPRHSAFYQTCLSMLLEHLGTKTLVIGGFATDSCVMFSATDAYLRGFDLIVPSDGSAASEPKKHRIALEHMAGSLHARTPHCAQVAFVRRRKRVGVRIG